MQVVDMSVRRAAGNVPMAVNKIPPAVATIQKRQASIALIKTSRMSVRGHDHIPGAIHSSMLAFISMQALPPCGPRVKVAAS